MFYFVLFLKLISEDFNRARQELVVTSNQGKDLARSIKAQLFIECSGPDHLVSYDMSHMIWLIRKPNGRA